MPTACLARPEAAEEDAIDYLCISTYPQDSDHGSLFNGFLLLWSPFNTILTDV